MNYEFMNSDIHNFHRMEINDRRDIIKELSNLNEDDMDIMNNYVDENSFDMIENVYTLMSLPVGIATNFRINGSDYLIPMSIEEPSVIAACSNGAKYARLLGGFTAYSTESIMRGEIEIYNIPDIELAIIKIMKEKNKILEMANTRSKTLTRLNAGAINIEFKIIDNEIILYLIVNVKDAMGANVINTMLEYISGYIENITGGKTNLRIMSNLTTERITYAYAKFDGNTLGEEIVDRIIMANNFAKNDIYRATTHNKGIMNGIDAVLLATLNDFRAEEANAHAYASMNGYKPLTEYAKDNDGNLIGSIRIPVAVGTVGGATKTSKKAQLNMKILGIRDSNEFANVLASVGLAQNFAALRALADEGIQKGHMKLHARNIAISAGATGSKIDKIVNTMLDENNISYSRAIELLNGDKNGKL